MPVIPFKIKKALFVYSVEGLCILFIVYIEPYSRDRELRLIHETEERKGFALKFCLKCRACVWFKPFYSSPEFKYDQEETRGKKPLEVNVRSLVAFREIGRGYEAMNTFTTLLNMPQPMAKTTYNDINVKLHPYYVKTAEESMKAAAEEVRMYINPDVSKNDVVDCDISCDGSWQKRGHSSLNGIVSVISRDVKKVIDCKVYSKYCHGCQQWEGKKTLLHIYSERKIMNAMPIILKAPGPWNLLGP